LSGRRAIAAFRAGSFKTLSGTALFSLKRLLGFATRTTSFDAMFLDGSLSAMLITYDAVVDTSAPRKVSLLVVRCEVTVLLDEIDEGLPFQIGPRFVAGI
jgi:hypothetical protein